MFLIKLKKCIIWLSYFKVQNLQPRNQKKRWSWMGNRFNMFSKLFSLKQMLHFANVLSSNCGKYFLLTRFVVEFIFLMGIFSARPTYLLWSSFFLLQQTVNFSKQHAWTETNLPRSALDENNSESVVHLLISCAKLVSCQIKYAAILCVGWPFQTALQE